MVLWGVFSSAFFVVWIIDAKSHSTLFVVTTVATLVCGAAATFLLRRRCAT
jgi:hypothetical protein